MWVSVLRAERDIDRAISWLADQCPAATDRWRVGYLSVLDQLESNPHHFPIAEESADLGCEIRPGQMARVLRGLNSEARLEFENEFKSHIDRMYTTS